MTRTVYSIIVVLFAFGCTPVPASEKEVSTREDARDAALWTLITSDKK